MFRALSPGLVRHAKAHKLSPQLVTRTFASNAPASDKIATALEPPADAVDTKNIENLTPRAVPPLNKGDLPKGNLISHVLYQYKGNTGQYDVPITGWKRALGENVIKLFRMDMDRVRSGPVAGALYRDQCKSQAWFQKNKPLSETADFYYNRLGMPQTYFQWFQITSLHVWMLYVRMRMMPRKYGREYQRKLVDGLFDDIDFQMRETIHINSDRTVNNYKKVFSSQLRGSVFGYDEAIVAGDDVLAAAIWRNLFEQSPVVDLTILEHLVHYVRAQLYVLDKISDVDFAAGRFTFIDPHYRYEPLTEEQDASLANMIESARKEPGLAATQSKLSRDGW